MLGRWGDGEMGRWGGGGGVGELVNLTQKLTRENDSNLVEIQSILL